MRALLVAGADPNAPPGADGFTALGNAIVTDSLEITKMLLVAGAQADIAFASRSPKLTAPQAASKKGHVVTAVLDVPSGNVPNVSFSNDFAMTALQMAAIFGHYKLVSLLLEVGVNVNGQPSQYGESALNWSLEIGYEDVA